MFWNELALVNRNPFNDVSYLQKEMNRLFNGVSSEARVYPPVNLWGNSDELVLKAEVPGLDPEKISVTVTGTKLTIEGTSKPAKCDENMICHRRERETGAFVRSIRLPYPVENGKVSAKYSNGVLTVALPRAEVNKPKKIEIKCS